MDNIKFNYNLEFKNNSNINLCKYNTPLIKNHCDNIPHYSYDKNFSILENCHMCLVEFKNSPKPIVSAVFQIFKQYYMGTDVINYIRSCGVDPKTGDDRYPDTHGEFTEHFYKFKNVLAELKNGEEVIKIATSDLNSSMKLRSDETLKTLSQQDPASLLRNADSFRDCTTDNWQTIRESLQSHFIHNNSLADLVSNVSNSMQHLPFKELEILKIMAETESETFILLLMQPVLISKVGTAVMLHSLLYFYCSGNFADKVSDNVIWQKLQSFYNDYCKNTTNSSVLRYDTMPFFEEVFGEELAERMADAVLTETSPFFEKAFGEELAERMVNAVLQDDIQLSERVADAVLKDNIRLAERMADAILEDIRAERVANTALEADIQISERMANVVLQDDIQLAERRANTPRGHIPAFEDSLSKERKKQLIQDIITEVESKDCMAIAVSPHLFTFFENNDFNILREEVGNSELYVRYSNFEWRGTMEEYRYVLMPDGTVTTLPRYGDGRFYHHPDEMVNYTLGWFSQAVGKSVLTPKMRCTLPEEILEGILTVHSANHRANFVAHGELGFSTWTVLNHAVNTYEGRPMVKPWVDARNLYEYTSNIRYSANIPAEPRDVFFDHTGVAQEVNGSALRKRLVTVLESLSPEQRETLVDFARRFEYPAFCAILPFLLDGIGDKNLILKNWLFLNTPGNFSQLMQGAAGIIEISSIPGN